MNQKKYQNCFFMEYKTLEFESTKVLASEDDPTPKWYIVAADSRETKQEWVRLRGPHGWNFLARNIGRGRHHFLELKSYRGVHYAFEEYLFEQLEAKKLRPQDIVLTIESDLMFGGCDMEEHLKKRLTELWGLFGNEDDDSDESRQLGSALPVIAGAEFGCYEPPLGDCSLYGHFANRNSRIRDRMRKHFGFENVIDKGFGPFGSKMRYELLNSGFFGGSVNDLMRMFRLRREAEVYGPPAILPILDESDGKKKRVKAMAYGPSAQGLAADLMLNYRHRTLISLDYAGVIVTNLFRHRLQGVIEYDNGRWVNREANNIPLCFLHNNGNVDLQGCPMNNLTDEYYKLDI